MSNANLVRSVAGPAVFERSRDRISLALAGGAVAVIVLMAALAPLLAPYSPTGTNLLAVSQPPFTPGHMLGTDSLGRDVLSRVIWGARPPVLIALCSVGIGIVVGVSLGILAGYVRGGVDHVLGRLADIQLSIPGLVLALVFLSIYGTSMLNVVIIIAVESWPLYFRVIRSQVMRVRSDAYVDAARMAGLSHLRIVVRHVLPACFPVLIVIVALNFTAAVLAESSLSFLGVGVQPPTADWGVMIAEGQSQLASAWWATVFPGFFLVVLLLSFQVLADEFSARFSVRDIAVEGAR